MRKLTPWFLCTVLLLLVAADRTYEHNGVDDLRFPVSSVKRVGNSDPSWTNCIGGIYCLAFDDGGADDEVMIFPQFPHSRQLGSVWVPHYHWSLEDATDCNVVWCFEYTEADVGEVFGATSTICVTDNSNSTAMSHSYATHGEQSGAGMTDLSAMQLGRVYRDGDNAADTCNGKEAYLYEFDIHFYMDSIGSSLELTK